MAHGADASLPDAVTANLQRKPNWPTLLNLFLFSRRESPFIWGQNDCALFACDAILALTGVDTAAPFRGRYHTEIGAAKAMRRFAGGGLREVTDRITALWNMSCRPSLLLAQRGDLVLLHSAIGEGLGIVTLDPRYVAAFGPAGYNRVPIHNCTACWKV